MKQQMNRMASLRLCRVNFAYAVRFIAYRYFYCFYFYFMGKKQNAQRAVAAGVR